MIADRSGIRLHPVQGPYVAIRTKKIITEDGVDKTAVGYEELEKLAPEETPQRRTTSGGFQVPGDLYVHPTGYYLTKEVYLLRHNGPSETIGLKNILSNDHSHSTELDPDIDVTTLCVLSQTAQRHTICAFNRERNIIRLYHLEPSDALFMYAHSPKDIQASNAFEYKGKSVDALSFTGEKNIFSSMAVVEDPQDSTKSCLAVAYTNGCVKLYRDFVEIAELQACVDNYDVRLFSNKANILAIHNDGQNYIRFVNIKDNSSCAIPFYPHRELKLSADGKYLTALADDNQSNVVHCLEMSNPEFRNITLKAPVTDFVVGGKHGTAVSVNAKGTIKVEGTIEELLGKNLVKERRNFLDKFHRKDSDATEKKVNRPK